jgi:protein SCO1/2
MTHPFPRRLLPALACPALLTPRSTAAWELFSPIVPDVRLFDQARRPWLFRSQVMAERPAVAIELIYAGCTSICPLSTRVMAEARRALGAEASGLRCISLTLDPDTDTPERLAAYAASVDAAEATESGDWLFLTGARQDMRQVLRALRARYGHPDDHAPVFFVGDGRRLQLRQLFAIPWPEELAEEMRAVSRAAARPR